MAKGFLNYVKVAKSCQIWSHCSRVTGTGGGMRKNRLSETYFGAITMKLFCHDIWLHKITF